ncbi:MAG TPA: hypothetical protein DHU55_08625, partial [Blastocatellia bacterium]|nr:hypothetical protein [Blastocatellia bacterium]
MTVPEQPSDIATFAKSNTTAIAISSSIVIDSIVFNANASSFTISSTPSLVFSVGGAGIINNSGVAQNFVIPNNGIAGATMRFSGSATAGNLTSFDNGGGLLQFAASSSAGNGTFITNELGETKFQSNATADHGTFVTNGSAASGSFGGFMVFIDSSTAGNATITINGGAAPGATEAGMDFVTRSTAANAVITVNGGEVEGADGGRANFVGGSSADNATLIVNGGVGDGGAITFFDNSSGGAARVEVFGSGSVDISEHNAPGVIVGSLEGDGLVFLGANNLTVGSTNLSTTFSGVMQDGGIGGGTGGSLTKTGTGKLSLTKANTYTGGTILNAGALFVKNKTGSATGTGAVQVNNGTLGGTGKIAGAVTVGTGSSSGAILLAGNSAKKPGTLTINSALTFNSLSTYKCVLNRATPKASKVSALGVT